jgi:hypothetical protein
MRVKAIECKTCGDKIYSRTEGDFRECECGLINVEGGQVHFKYEVKDNAPHEKLFISLDCSVADLYNDWQDMTDFYGLIKAKDVHTKNIKHKYIF